MPESERKLINGVCLESTTGRSGEEICATQMSEDISSAYIAKMRQNKVSDIFALQTLRRTSGIRIRVLGFTSDLYLFPIGCNPISGAIFVLLVLVQRVYMG
jgi:hypothetical protein